MAVACVETLSRKYGIPVEDAEVLYEEVMTTIREVLREGNFESIGKWDIEAEFVRQADPATKQRVAIEAKGAIEKRSKRKIARELMTQSAATNADAHITEFLYDAQMLSAMREGMGWYKDLGKTDPVKAFKAFMMGDGSGLPGSRKSLSRLRESYDRQDFSLLIEYFQAHPEVDKMLNGVFESFNHSKQSAFRTNARKFFVQVIDDMMGDNFDAGTKESAFAKTLRHMTEQSTGRFVESGAFMQQRKGYTPYMPSSTAISQVAREDFVSMTLGEGIIDWRTAYPDNDLGRIARGDPSDPRTIKAREDLLGQMWDIYSGRAERAVDGTGKKGDAVAARYEKGLQLRFTDGEAWMKFHEMWGRAQDPLGLITSKINEQNRMASVMHGFGPQPEKGAFIVAQRLIERIRRGEVQLAPKVEAKVLAQLGAFNPMGGSRIVHDLKFDGIKSTFDSIQTIVNPHDGGLSMAFSEISGDTLYTVNGQVAKWASRMRVAKNMAALGRAVITAMTDVPNILFANVARGRNWTESVKAMVDAHKLRANMSSAEFSEIAPYIRMFADGSIGQYHSRFTLDEHGTMSKLQAMYFKTNFLTQWTDSMRQMSAITNMSWLGDNAGKGWENLPSRMKTTLAAHSITPEKWDALRETAWTGPDGQTYLIPGKIDELGLDRARMLAGIAQPNTALPWGAQRHFESKREGYVKDPELYKRQLKSELIGMLNDEVRYGVVESDDRVRYFSVRGTAPGSLTGEILRFMMQYKSYAIGLADRTWSRALFSGEGQGHALLPDRVSADMNLPKWIALSIATGYLTQGLSDLSKGYEPRDVTGEHGWQTFMSAMKKSGAGAVYGDMVFDSFNGYDKTWLHTAVGSVLGPVGDTGMDAAEVLWAGLQSGEKGFQKALTLAMNNCPYQNIFYARAALDYGVLYHLEEMFNPGVVGRRHQWNAENLGREALYEF